MCHSEEQKELNLVQCISLYLMNQEKFVEITFTNLDSNGSGKISFADFKKAIVLEPRLVECFLMELPAAKRGN
jgi:hypothetical protein